MSRLPTSLGGLLLATLALAPPASADTWAVVHARILPSSGAMAIEDGTLVVREGRLPPSVPRRRSRSPRAPTASTGRVGPAGRVLERARALHRPAIRRGGDPARGRAEPGVPGDAHLARIHHRGGPGLVRGKHRRAPRSGSRRSTARGLSRWGSPAFRWMGSRSTSSGRWARRWPPSCPSPAPRRRRRRWCGERRPRCRGDQQSSPAPGWGPEDRGDEAGGGARRHRGGAPGGAPGLCPSPDG